MKLAAMAAISVVITGLTNCTYAADGANPTGTWKWSVTANNQTRETTLTLKLEDDKLTGAVVGNNKRETAIDDAAFKDGEVSFAVTRERNGQKFTVKYKGKLEGDTIKGTSESERDGKKRSREWEAKREAASSEKTS
jgi:hypothetical protein